MADEPTNGNVQRYRIDTLEDCMNEVRGKLDILIAGQAAQREVMEVYKAGRVSTCPIPESLILPLDKRVRLLEDWRNYMLGGMLIMTGIAGYFIQYLLGKV